MPLVRSLRAFGLLVAGIWISSACAVVQGQPIARLALLAPFEGRYREVGYNALYAARLALHDSGVENFELLAVDEGGTLESAISRARALSLDPAVYVVLALGYAASSGEAQQAFGGVPVLVVGDWSAQSTTDTTFVLSTPALDDLITVPPEVNVTEAARLEPPLVGGEVLALAQFPRLRASLDGITIVSSGVLPDADFRARYTSYDQFAPEPGLLATLAYDAARLAVQAVVNGGRSREDVRAALASMTFDGLNGPIRFENGYWADAPVHYYVYDANRRLVAVDDVVK